MTTQPKEVLGTVIGYGIVASPGSAHEQRIHFTTLEEWNDLDRRLENGEFEGIELFTRILGPNGIEENEGVDCSIPTPGYQLQKLTCKCGATAWFSWRAGSYSTSYRCEKC